MRWQPRLFVRDTRRQVIRRVQLATRGWADQDCWSLDVVLCQRLGAQLRHLADTDHGWPEQLYAEPEHWQNALRHHADLLQRYDPFEPDGDTGVEDARAALRWVANHLEWIWD